MGEQGMAAPAKPAVRDTKMSPTTRSVALPSPSASPSTRRKFLGVFIPKVDVHAKSTRASRGVAKRETVKPKKKPKPKPQSVCEPTGLVRVPTYRGLLELRTTYHLDKFFLFMHERHMMLIRRLRGEKPPWTTDEEMQYRLCNTFRLYDRGSQYVVDKVINSFAGDSSLPSTPEGRLADFTDHFVRISVFFAFKRVSTWEMLERVVGGPGKLTGRSFLDNLDYLITVLEAQYWRADEAKPTSKKPTVKKATAAELAKLAKVAAKWSHGTESLYTGAYKNQSVKVVPGREQKLVDEGLMCVRHMWQVEAMLKDGLPATLLGMSSFEEIVAELYRWSGIGPFLGFQLALDLNMSPYLQLPETNFACPGPGARGGLGSIFPSLITSDPKGILVHPDQLAAMRFLAASQHRYWDRLGLSSTVPGPIDANGDPIPGLPREVTIVEIEHALCEYHKLCDMLSKRKKPEEFRGTIRPATVYRPKRFPEGWRDQLVGGVGGVKEDLKSESRDSSASSAGASSYSSERRTADTPLTDGVDSANDSRLSEKIFGGDNDLSDVGAGEQEKPGLGKRSRLSQTSASSAKKPRLR